MAPEVHPASSTSSGRLLYRIGAVSAILGSLIALAGNALHPRVSSSDLGDPVAFLRLVHESSMWTTAHAAIIVAALLFLGGQVAIYESLRAGRAAALARLALASALVGGATNLIVLAIDGIVMSEVAEAWATAPAAEKAAALQAGAAMYHLDFGLFSILTALMFFGVPFILYGLSVVSSEPYPRWLGWVAVVGGSGAAAVGLVEAYAGVTAATFLILFPILAAMLSIWLLVMGVLLWRRANAATSQ